MLKIGAYNTLEVARKVEFGYYLRDESGEQVLLPLRYAGRGLELGEERRLFVYTDGENRPVATTQTPKAVAGEFAFLRVKELNRVGAFLDWGLDKDLFVPFREQKRPLQQDRSYVVYIEVDEASNRVIGTTWLDKHFSKDVGHLTEGQEVELLVCGFSAISITTVVNRHYLGILYKDKTFEELHLGDSRKGYIQKVKESWALDVTLYRPGYHGAIDQTADVLERMRRAGGFLPYTSKSSSEAIRNAFHMSRNTFKRIIGNLYKQGVITIADDGIRLTADEGQNSD